MNHDYPDPVELIIHGFRVVVDNTMGHLCVAHDGTITWDQLQSIKTDVWGYSARAIEVYPAENMIINNAPMRHLWRLGDDDFCPDLLGRTEPKKTLEARFHKAWKE